MPKTPDLPGNDIPGRMLKSPPKPFTPKAKPSPFPPATKAERAALKRIDKTVIKRMRKR
jgi:hypothetical protein